jgi:flagellar M-ring protein FliF
VEGFLQVLKNLGAVRLALMGAILVGLASALTYVSNRMTAPDLALLYSDLEMEDAGKIVSRLETMGVPVEVRGGGTQIYAPSDRVARLRVELAELGLPRGGSVGYEIFDKTDQLGVSSFVQNINHLRALEGEIARTITAMAQVSAARVHLVLPKRRLFSREKEEPSAAIMLTLAGAGLLPQRRIQAIQQLVAAAVPGLLPERVSIVDDRGNLLAKGDGHSEATEASNFEEKRLAYETRLTKTIENLVARYVGDGKVKAEVFADMSFDRVTENSETYDPDGQVARSTQTTSLGEQSHEADSNVSVEKNLPNAKTQQGGGSDNKLSRSEETTNFEISKKTKTLVKEVGEIKRLSVAVLVDGLYTPVEGKKEQDYKPRSDDELKNLTKLIKNAVGFNEKRGDSIEVVNMRFAPMEMVEATEAPSTIMGLEKHDLIHLAEVLLIGVLALLGILLGVKPMVNKILSGVQPAIRPVSDEEALAIANEDRRALPGGGTTQAALGGPTSAGALPGPDGTPEGSEAYVANTLKELEHMVTMNQVEGQVRASSLKTVGDIINDNPEAAVNVIRTWMMEDDKKRNTA